MKHPINQKYTETSIDEDTNSKSREIAWSPFFCNFKMSLFRLKYPGIFLKNPHSPDLEEPLWSMYNVVSNFVPWGCVVSL